MRLTPIVQVLACMAAFAATARAADPPADPPAADAAAVAESEAAGCGCGGAADPAALRPAPDPISAPAAEGSGAKGPDGKCKDAAGSEIDPPCGTGENLECYKCQPNSCEFQCDHDDEPGNDDCHTCDTDGDKKPDSCCIVESVSGPNCILIGEEATFTAEGEGLKCVTWSGGGTPAAGQGASFTTRWDSAGEKTVTAAGAGSRSTSMTVKVGELVSLEPYTEATCRTDEAIVTTKLDGEYVVLTAKTEPDVKCVWDRISWSGGEAVPGSENNQRRVPLKDCGVFEIKATLGASEKEQTVVVVWVTFDKFQIVGPKPNDSSVEPLVWGTPADQAMNGVLLRATVCPENAADYGVTFDIKRTIERTTWFKDYTGGWARSVNLYAGTNDDIRNTDEDLVPSDDGHIYVLDNPGLIGPPDPEDREYVSVASFVESVKTNCGMHCSDDYPWHSQTWSEDDGTGKWRRKVGKANEIAPGAIEVNHGFRP